LIADAVMYRLDGPALAAHLATPADGPADDARQDLLAAEAHLDELAAAYGEGAISLREFLRARAPIEKRIRTSRSALSRQRQMAALDPFLDRPAALRSAWPTLTLSRQHAVITSVLSHVTVKPANRGSNRFDPDRFAPVWRV
jgi:hypothetical protein